MSKRELTSETILKLHSRMIKHASMSNHPYPDDIAQEYVIRLLSGLHQRATIGQAYIDIVRKSSGRKSKLDEGDKTFFSRLNLTKPGVINSEYILSVQEHKEVLSLDDRIYLNQIVNKVKHLKARQVIMWRIEGWTIKEISEKLKCTEGNVHALIKRHLGKVI